MTIKTNELLDNPIWYSLQTNHQHLGITNQEVSYYDADVAPFYGLQQLNTTGVQALYEQLPLNKVAVLITKQPLPFAEPFTIMLQEPIYQMVYTHEKIVTIPNTTIVPLQETHIAEMIALTKLTQPGPFEKRTIAFGNYIGIFKEDTLVAMAGQRMHAMHCMEISAVCTHPDYTGNGYGKALVATMVQTILENNQIPFLHVRVNNAPAIAVYEQLGFSLRAEMQLNVVKRIA